MSDQTTSKIFPIVLHPLRALESGPVGKVKIVSWSPINFEEPQEASSVSLSLSKKNYKNKISIL
jgi:hypothetical protein